MNLQNLIKLSVLASISALGWLAFSTAETQATGSASASPRSLYMANCASCHGADGKSNTPKGRETDADDISGGGISAAKITRIVKNGKGDMPAFGKRLTAAQVKQITTYVRTL